MDKGDKLRAIEKIATSIRIAVRQGGGSEKNHSGMKSQACSLTEALHKMSEREARPILKMFKWKNPEKQKKYSQASSFLTLF